MNRFIKIAFVAAPLLLSGGAFAQSQEGNPVPSDQGSQGTQGSQGKTEMGAPSDQGATQLNAPSGTPDTSGTNKEAFPRDTTTPPPVPPVDTGKTTPPTTGNPGDINK
jgi:hypothetical protein